jgi:hypothetical protein
MLKKLIAVVAGRSRRCRCGILAELTSDPEAPVRLDETTGEYHLQLKTHGFAVLHYCPFCGGGMSPSLQRARATRIPRSEKERLVKMFMDLKTTDDVVARLGRPDYDSGAGVMSSGSGDKYGTEKAEMVRVLRYTRISDVASAVVCERANGSIGVVLEAKPQRDA